MRCANMKLNIAQTRRLKALVSGFVCSILIITGEMCAYAAEPAPYGTSSTTASQRKQWDKEALKENYGEGDPQNQAGHNGGAGANGLNGANGNNSSGNNSSGLAGAQQKPTTGVTATGIPGGFIDKATTEFKNITYFVVNQPLQAVMGEIVYLAGLQANLEQLPEITVTNTQFQGSLDVVMDQLAKRYGLIWNIESGIIDIAPLKSLITRAIKVEGMNEERIVELLAAAGIGARKDVIALDESTGILRIRGTPRFVAKAEAAILLGKAQAATGGAPDESVHVVRYGRTSRVVNPQ